MKHAEQFCFHVLFLVFADLSLLGRKCKSNLVGKYLTPSCKHGQKDIGFEGGAEQRTEESMAAESQVLNKKKTFQREGGGTNATFK